MDPDEETVEIRTLDDDRVVRGSDEARSRVVEGFVVVPEELFAILR